MSSDAAVPAAAHRSISVHPLVIINAADFYTATSTARVVAPEDNGDGDNAVEASEEVQRKAFGALFGTQSGRTVRVCDSCELVMTPDGSKLDDAFLRSKVQQIVQVFPSYELLGWWTAAPRLTAADMAIHQQLTAHNEMPLLLHLDPSSDCENLPVKIYESVFQAAINSSIFVNVDFVIDTSDSERVAVDYVMQSAATARERSSSALASHARTLKSAIGMLAERMRAIKTYLESVRSGSAPRNEVKLRAAASLLNQLPLLPFDEIKDEYCAQRDDARLIMYLARLTSGLHGADEVVRKYMSSGMDAGQGQGEEPTSTSSWSAKKMGTRGGMRVEERRHQRGKRRSGRG